MSGKDKVYKQTLKTQCLPYGYTLISFFITILSPLVELIITGQIKEWSRAREEGLEKVLIRTEPLQEEAGCLPFLPVWSSLPQQVTHTGSCKHQYKLASNVQLVVKLSYIAVNADLQSK